MPVTAARTSGTAGLDRADDGRLPVLPLRARLARTTSRSSA